jgi:hypothetical protein
MVLLTYKKYTNQLHSLDSRRRKIRKLPPGRGLQFQSYHQYLVFILVPVLFPIQPHVLSSPSEFSLRSRELDDIVRNLKDLLG